MFCPRCGYGQSSDHSYCVACGAALPVWQPASGPKESRWYVAVPVVPQDPPGAAVRVSRYTQEFDWETDDGAVRVPADHVRISVWVDDEVRAAVSLSETDAHDLALFLLGIEQPASPTAEGPAEGASNRERQQRPA